MRSLVFTLILFGVGLQIALVPTDEHNNGNTDKKNVHYMLQ